VSPAEVTLQQVRDAWPEILDVVQKAKRTAWMVVFTAKPLELRDGGILVLSFPSQNDVDALRQQTTPGEGVGDYLKKAVFDVLGFTPKLLARAETTRAESAKAAAAQVSAPATSPAPGAATVSSAEAGDAPEPTEPDDEPPTPDGAHWYTAPVSDSEPETRPVRPKDAPKSAPRNTSKSAPKAQAKAAVAPSTTAEPAPTEPAPATQTAATQEAAAPGPRSRKSEKPAYEKARYGESVVREILGASFIEEQTVAPRVTPREG
jgi:DNA polymerase-3 subunit gamma/tau